MKKDENLEQHLKDVVAEACLNKDVAQCELLEAQEELEAAEKSLRNFYNQT